MNLVGLYQLFVKDPQLQVLTCCHRKGEGTGRGTTTIRSVQQMIDKTEINLHYKIERIGR